MYVFRHTFVDPHQVFDAADHVTREKGAKKDTWTVTKKGIRFTRIYKF